MNPHSPGRYLVSGLDLCTVALGDAVCLFFWTASLVRALLSFSFSRSLSFFSFFFLSTFKEDVTASGYNHRVFAGERARVPVWNCACAGAA